MLLFEPKKNPLSTQEPEDALQKEDWEALEAMGVDDEGVGDEEAWRLAREDPRPIDNLAPLCPICGESIIGKFLPGGLLARCCEQFITSAGAPLLLSDDLKDG